MVRRETCLLRRDFVEIRGQWLCGHGTQVMSTHPPSPSQYYSIYFGEIVGDRRPRCDTDQMQHQWMHTLRSRRATHASSEARWKSSCSTHGTCMYVRLPPQSSNCNMTHDRLNRTGGFSDGVGGGTRRGAHDRAPGFSCQPNLPAGVRSCEGGELCICHVFVFRKTLQ